MRRRHAERYGRVIHADPVFFHARRAASTWIEQPDSWTNELLKVLVARNHDDVQPSRGGLTGQRADHVVGLITPHRYDRYAIRLEELPDALHAAIEIRLELLGELLARRLVGRVGLVTER